MDSSKFLHEHNQNTNHVHDDRESDDEIHQISQQSLITINILKEPRQSIPKLWMSFH